MSEKIDANSARERGSRRNTASVSKTLPNGPLRRPHSRINQRPEDDPPARRDRRAVHQVLTLRRTEIKSKQN